MRILVPAGFMPVVSASGVMIEICVGTVQAPIGVTKAMPTAMVPAMTIHGMAHHSDKSDRSAADMPCAFSGLTAPSMAAADPVLLAIAIAFITGIVFRLRTAASIAAHPYLTPPLRGPPPFPAG
ncbi:hypothetical protein [Sphingomonas sp. HMP9]|uniref:hypothetical protein n=1 Tax=Sphingomonas sp. HMP9 TaxID=1517554 RepID=UPI001E45B882|nr:hypothetical protein [Sphingomonas sp. HMP9]